MSSGVHFLLRQFKTLCRKTGKPADVARSLFVPTVTVLTLHATTVLAQLEQKDGVPDTEQTVAVVPLIPTVHASAPATAASDVPAAAPLKPVASVWQLRLEDERIDLALARWSRDAGYAYRWDADRFFPIAAPTAFNATFEEALRSVLASPGIIKSSYPLEACIYANTPPLIRITRLGDQAQECR